MSRGRRWTDIGSTSPTAEQFAVAVSHQGDAALHQTDSAVAEGGGLPSFALPVARAEEGFGYVSIRRCSKMSIERTHHEDKAIATLHGKSTERSSGSRESAMHLRPKA